MKMDLPREPSEQVEGLLSWAVRENATDLHFAPFADGYTVRARIDGLLREVCRLEAEAAPRVLSRVKVLAEMDIAEKRRPQDGRISRVQNGQTVDFRVSSIPALHGESLVLRILDRSAGLRSVEQLGLPEREVRLLRSFLQQSSGMTVVCGPTGAGKTTTLYAALQLLASPERNVLTIEDPIEYEFPRVLQTSVKEKLGITFSALLRSLLRHDPDVIMVGEVRDGDTAEVSVRAALTGHLVLTSLHTERAAHAVSAFLNYGVRPYALAPALRGVLAQQLIRMICPSCRTRFEYGERYLDDPEFSGILAEGERPSFSVGLGCEACFHSGYRGRRGIFEVLEVSEGIRRKIQGSADVHAIESAAVEAGMATLRRNGFRAVLEGVTTVEEVVRVVPLD